MKTPFSTIFRHLFESKSVIDQSSIEKSSQEKSACPKKLFS
jgi:hypothetical protein